MKRLYLVFLLLACLTMVGYAQEKRDITNQSVQNPSLLRQLLTNRFDLVEDDIADIQALQSKGRAHYFYVCSVNGASTYTGEDADHPLSTLDAAVAKCTANRGDIIFVLQNHAETLAGADAVDLDVAGVTVIGLGVGDDRPTFTFDTTTDEFVIGRDGDNVTIYNLCFFPSVSECVHGIDVEDGADNVAIINCEFLESTTAANEFDKMITVAVEANDLTIENCRFTSADAAGCTDAIEIGDGVAVRFKLIHCKFHGAFATAALFSDQACTDALLLENIFSNTTTTVAAVSLTGAWTGFAIRNSLYADTWGTAGVQVFDPGSLSCIENYGAIAADKPGSIVPSVSLGQDIHQWINGADGMSTWQNGAKPANGVSLAEGLRYLVELFANGTPATITAPGTNQTILDILGTDGTTTTGAVAGSVLGAIGTNEAVGSTPFSSSTVAADKDGSVLEREEAIQSAQTPNYNHPNYFIVTVDVNSATWNTAAAHEVVTVTGACRVQMLIECTETVTSTGSDSTFALGFESNAAAIIAATDWDSGGAQFAAGDVVSTVYAAVCTSPASGADTWTGITGALIDVVVVGGKDIGYTIGTADADNGTLIFHVWWQPLDATGACVAGAGGTL